MWKADFLRYAWRCHGEHREDSASVCVCVCVLVCLCVSVKMAACVCEDVCARVEGKGEGRRTDKKNGLNDTQPHLEAFLGLESASATCADDAAKPRACVTVRQRGSHIGYLTCLTRPQVSLVPLPLLHYLLSLTYLATVRL